ncbi:MAG: glucokinase [Chlamydiota bacterium]
MIYLAADVGGTKTRLALFKEERGTVVCLKERKFPSRKYPNLRLILKEFLKGVNEKVTKGCFGIAGPVKEGKSRATNLPWSVESEVLARELSTGEVALINDLEANAYGLNMLREDEFFILNQGDKKAVGNKALVSAGTGLGEAGVFFDGKRNIPFACEGGHTDFAPRDEREDSLLRFLRKKFEHVSYERILSGPGLYDVYRFIVETRIEKEREQVVREIVAGDSPRLISEKGLSGSSAACRKALELFVSIYGAEAGNVALKIFALGGVYIGGGIAPKLLSLIKEGGFIDSFKRKGRFSSLLGAIPVRIVLNEKTALLGSMYYAKHIM